MGLIEDENWALEAKTLFICPYFFVEEVVVGN